MSIERSFRKTTKRTAKLLSGGENQFVDFKKVAKGVQTEDLVAFANSENGGDLLIGIVEDQDVNGAQFGRVVGCDLSDSAILQILNKAIECRPPVSIRCFAENTDDIGFLRIRVDASESKPHSTPKGIYCIRDGSRNRPLHPPELLELFINVEGNAFASKFSEAAKMISGNLDDLESSLTGVIQSMGDQLEWAQMNLGETENSLDAILSYVAYQNRETNKISDRLRALFRQDDRDDPVRDSVKAEATKQLVQYFVDNPETLEEISEGKNYRANLTGEQAKDLYENDAEEILKSAIVDLKKAVKSEVNRRKK